MTDESPAVEAGRPLGLTARQAALVAWSGAWVTGILWLWLEPSHPFVRHHAAHAAVLMGGLMALALGLWVSCLLAAFVSPSLFRLLAWTATLAWGLFLCGWIYGLTGAWRSRRLRLPGITPRADRLAGVAPPAPSAAAAR